jgi:hypothetical protein
MTSDRLNVRCPAYRWRFKTSVQPGSKAWCKKCSHEFMVEAK